MDLLQEQKPRDNADWREINNRHDTRDDAH